MKLWHSSRDGCQQLLLLSEKYLKIHPLTLLGFFIYMGLFYDGLFILPQRLHTPEFLIALLLGTAALLFEPRLRGGLLSGALMAGMFFLPLSWFWRGLDYDYAVFAGIFPLNDANGYLNEALRLLNGLNFTEFATRRPIYAGLLSFFMWISGHNLFFAIGVFCALTGLGVALLTWEIRKIAGPLTAAFVFLSGFYYMTAYQGQTMTENVGLALGALGLAIVLRGIRYHNQYFLMLGVFSLTLGLNARAGAFFVLPAILLWAYLQRARLPGRGLVFWLAGVMALGFGLNLFLTKAIGSPSGQAFSNFSYTLYGLAAGYKGWSYIYSVNSHVTDQSVYPLAFELIRKSPLTLLSGMLISIQDYLRPEVMIGYLTLDTLQGPFRIAFAILSWLGLIRMWWQRKNIYWSLGLFLFAGCLSSMAFLPPIDAFIRPLAATITIIGLLAGFVFFVDQTQPPSESGRVFVNFLPEVCVSLLALIILGGPLLVRASGHLPVSAEGAACPAGYEKLSLDLFPGGYMNLTTSGAPYAFLPNVREKDIIRISKAYPFVPIPGILEEWPALEKFIQSLQAGDTLLMGVTHQDLAAPAGPQKVIFVVTRTAAIQTFQGPNNFCASLAAEPRLNENRFYYDISAGADQGN